MPSDSSTRRTRRSTGASSSTSSTTAGPPSSLVRGTPAARGRVAPTGDRCTRQHDLNVRAVTRRARERHRPAGLPHDTIRRRQPKALPQRPRREERVEERWPAWPRPCRCRCAHRHHQCGPPRCQGARARASSSRRSRTSTADVRPSGMASRALTTRLKMTCSIWPGRRAPRPVRTATMTTSLTSSPKRRVSILGGRRHHADVDDPGSMIWHRLNASSCRVSDAPRITAYRYLVPVEPARVPGVELRVEQVAVADDGGEQVVEVVRDATGEAPHRIRRWACRTDSSSLRWWVASRNRQRCAVTAPPAAIGQ